MIIIYCSGMLITISTAQIIPWVVPLPRMPVANEGLGWDSLRKWFIILVVTGILGRGTTQIIPIHNQCLKEKYLLQTNHLFFPVFKMVQVPGCDSGWRWSKIFASEWVWHTYIHIPFLTYTVYPLPPIIMVQWVQWMYLQYDRFLSFREIFHCLLSQRAMK